jgi:hypothetical protein
MNRMSLVVVGMLCARSLAAQGTVVAPEVPPDVAQAALRDELLRFRDTLNSIDAAAARLQRDFRQASTASLTSRAAVMRDACARSVRNVAPARKAVLAAKAPDERRLRKREEMVQALDLLRTVLTRCETDFRDLSRPGQGEKVRGYGNDRAVRVRSALRKYERVLGSFFSVMGIKVSPFGIEGRPPAG